jgi:DNA repair protein RecO (recombination protein O)
VSRRNPSPRCGFSSLLESIGYGLEFDVQPQGFYQYRPSHGLMEVREGAPGAYSGRNLLQLREESLDDAGALDAARRVLRQALDHCLEGRELRTRTVARSMTRRGPA